jgi:hypothetical protein
MNTQEVKAKIHDGANRVESGVAAAAASLGNGAEAIGEQALSEEAAKQARQRPLMVFGAAFVAGLLVARALRR